MRSKEDILAPWGKPENYTSHIVLAEVLLDIRKIAIDISSSLEEIRDRMK